MSLGSPLGLGCWYFGQAGSPGYDPVESLQTIRRAAEDGVTHFDTSSSYGQGYSEAMLGVALAGWETTTLVASKLTCADRDTTLKAVDASRLRLRRGTLDLYYIHWPRKGCDLREMMEALETARARGWLRMVGVSNFSTADMEVAAQAGRIDVHQTCYNLLWRWPEREVLPYCRERGIRVVTYASMAQGILSGKFGRHPRLHSADKRQELVYFDCDVWPYVHRAVTEMGRVVCEEVPKGLSLAQAALAWMMTRPDVDVVLAGARNRRQLAANLGVLDRPVPERLLQRLTELSDRAMAHVPDVGNIFRYYP